MSRDVQDALRRARLRQMTGQTSREAYDPDTEGDPEPGHYDVDGERQVGDAAVPHVHYLVLTLSDQERAELENLSGRYSYAQELLSGVLEDGRISDTAAWNARDALEDDTGKPWPSHLPQASPPLCQKISKLFDEVS